jgi:hypothetical protein
MFLMMETSPTRKVDAADGALMSILIGVGVTLVFFLGLLGRLEDRIGDDRRLGPKWSH